MAWCHCNVWRPENACLPPRKRREVAPKSRRARIFSLRESQKATPSAPESRRRRRRCVDQYIFIYTYIHVYNYICVYIHEVYIYVYMRIYIYEPHAYIHIYIYLYVYTHMCIYMHIYAPHVYVHTCTHLSFVILPRDTSYLLCPNRRCPL